MIECSTHREDVANPDARASCRYANIFHFPLMASDKRFGHATNVKLPCCVNTSTIEFHMPQSGPESTRNGSPETIPCPRYT